MSGYLLDTNIISDLIRNPSGAAAQRIAQLGAKGICTSIVVAAELGYGCAKKGSPRLLAKVQALLETIPVPERVSNCTFGGPDGNTLFITATTSLYRVTIAPSRIQG